MHDLNTAKLIYKVCKGKRYCVCMERTNILRSNASNLYELVSEMFGFGMADTKVYAYDLKENRVIEPKEYEKKMELVIQNQIVGNWKLIDRVKEIGEQGGKIEVREL